MTPDGRSTSQSILTSLSWPPRRVRGIDVVVHVSSAESPVAISVEGEDGSFWSVPFVEGTLTIEELPATQDYIISLTTAATAGTTNYTMEVIIYTP